jgi:hypothetical protein
MTTIGNTTMARRSTTTSRWYFKCRVVLTLSLLAWLAGGCGEPTPPESATAVLPTTALVGATGAATGEPGRTDESTVPEAPTPEPGATDQPSVSQPPTPVPNSSPAETATQAMTPGPPECTVGSIALHVRSGPATAFRSLGTLALGDGFVPLGRSSDCAWMLGDTRHGQGWSAAAFLHCPSGFDPCALPVATSPPTYTTPAPMTPDAMTPPTPGEAAPTLPTGIGVIPGPPLVPQPTVPPGAAEPSTRGRPDRPLRTLEPPPGGRLPGRRPPPAPPTSRPNPRVPPL